MKFIMSFLILMSSSVFANGVGTEILDYLNPNTSLTGVDSRGDTCTVETYSYDSPYGESVSLTIRGVTRRNNPGYVFFNNLVDYKLVSLDQTPSFLEINIKRQKSWDLGADTKSTLNIEVSEEGTAISITTKTKGLFGRWSKSAAGDCFLTLNQ